MLSTKSLHSEIDQVITRSGNAFLQYRQIPAAKRAEFLLAIAQHIEALGDALLQTAASETHLPLALLTGERGRTVGQLTMFAQMLRAGDWQEIIINTAIPDKNPPRPDIRRMLIPLGPVVVFGSSNFPFAYSTAGGDTASALAAGCTVVVKAHPAHLKTSILVAEAIKAAAIETGMPESVFQHVEEGSFETGKLLVQHPVTAAVGFTGSFPGGKALWDYAAARTNPIPVFAEMGSINPVLLFPDALETQYATLAQQYAASITLGVGQFCTNPGLLIAIEGAGLSPFVEALAKHLQEVSSAPMLHAGISDAYAKKVASALSIQGVHWITPQPSSVETGAALPVLARVSAADFLHNPTLHEEIFGPYSLLVVAESAEQMLLVLRIVKGQLTTSLMGTDKDFTAFAYVVQEASLVAGRIVCNGVPTGVEVCDAMVHGGPFPATTDPRFTAVGVQSIKRWLRPIAFQNFPDALLPDELKHTNPLGVVRVEK
jgi:NADP-dependent aldehyde dehydrogenase